MIPVLFVSLLVFLTLFICEVLASSSRRHADFYTIEANADRISRMPGYSGPLLSLFSGYITVSQSSQRRLFFAHVESSMQPSETSTTPLILWLNGGPGCSSIGGGLLTELGPFFPASRNTLRSNPHSWHKFAHLLFLESPAFTGFSYSHDKSDATVGDNRTAEDNLSFLLGFLSRYPHLKQSPLWLSGESYAGHYIPQLALAIIKHNNLNSKDLIHLAGITLGNPWTEPLLDNKGTVDHWFSHSMISNEVNEGMLKYCDFAASNPLDPHPQHVNPSTDDDRCDDYCSMADTEIGPVDIYNVPADDCHDWRSMGEGWSLRHHRNQLRAPSAAEIEEGESPLPDPPYDPCVENLAEAYLNRPDVQSSLHANQSQDQVNGPWVFCTSEIKASRLRLHYSLQDLQRPMLPTYEAIRSMQPDLRILIYSGDQDASVPTLGTRLWLSALGLRMNATATATVAEREIFESPDIRGKSPIKGKSPINSKWRAWMSSTGQVGGWIQPLKLQLNGIFATVRNAGHMVPYSQPERASFLVSRFINNQEIP